MDSPVDDSMAEIAAGKSVSSAVDFRELHREVKESAERKRKVG